MTNEEILKGKWNEIKGEIRTKWGKMTEDELDKLKGNVTSIAGLIQQRYGAKKDDVDSALNRIIARFSHKSEEIKKDLRDDNEQSLH